MRDARIGRWIPLLAMALGTASGAVVVWALVYIAITLPRIGEWRENGASEANIDFLIRSQSRYALYIGVIYGALSIIVGLLALRRVNYGSRWEVGGVLFLCALPFSILVAIVTVLMHPAWVFAAIPLLAAGSTLPAVLPWESWRP